MHKSILTLSWLLPYVINAIVNQPDTRLGAEYVGQWNSINDFIYGLTFVIPNLYNQNAGKILGSNLFVDITNILCGNAHFQDLDFSSNQSTNFNSTTFNINVSGFTLNCTFDWRYKWSFFSGSGSDANIYCDDEIQDMIETTLLLSTSQGAFNTGEPPNQSSTTQCTTRIQVTDIDFQRKDVLSTILDTFETFLRDTIEIKLQEAICKTLNRFGNVTLSSWLHRSSADIISYQNNSTVTSNWTQNEVEFLSSTNTVSDSWLYLTDLDNNKHPIIAWGWRQVQRILGTSNITATHPSYNISTINQLISKYVLDNSSSLKINLNRLIQVDQAQKIEVLLRSVTLSGLDTITQLDPLAFVPDSNFTFQSTIQLEYLGVQFDGAILIKSNNSRSESLSIKTELGNPSLSLVSSFILNMDKIGDIQIGRLFNLDEILNSVLQSSDLVKIVSLNLNVSLVDAPTVSGLNTRVENDTLSAILKALLDMYQVSILDAASGYFYSLLNKEAEKILQSVQTDYRNTTFMNDGFINFPDLFLPENDAIQHRGSGKSPYGNLVHTVKTAIDNLIMTGDPTSGLSRLNKLVIKPVTKLQSNISGSLYFPHVFEENLTFHFSDVRGLLHARLFDGAITNINSLNRSTLLLEPSNDHEISNYIAMKHINATISAQLLFVLNGDTYVNDIITLGLDVSGFKVYLNLLMLLRENAFLSFPIRSSRDLNCWLATLNPPILDEYGLGASTSLSVSTTKGLYDNLHFSLGCVPCTSDLLKYIYNTVSSSSKQEIVSNFFSQFLDTGIKAILDGPFETYMNRKVYDSHYKCRESASYRQNFNSSVFKTFEAQSKLSTTTPMSLSLFTIFLLFICLFGGYSLLAPRVNLFICMNSSDHHDNHPGRRNEAIKINPSSLCSSSHVPRLIRYFIPVLILSSIALHVMAQLCNAVTIELIVYSSSIDFPFNIYNASIVQATFNLWNANMRGESALIFAIFILLPYFQQAISFLLWITKPNVAHMRRRENVYRVIIFISQWTTLPLFIFINITSIATFRLTSPPQFSSIIPVNIFSIQLRILPDKGTSAFISAHFVSQCSILVALHYHRVLESNHSSLKGDQMKGEVVTHHGDEEESKTCDPTPVIVQDDTMPITQNILLKILLLAAASLTISFVVWGFLVPSFSVSVTGVLGAYITELRNSYSAWTLLKDNLSHTQVTADQYNKFGMGLLSILILCIIVIPICQVIVLLVRWSAKLSHHQRMRLITANEVLDAFQYLDVYIVGLIVTIWLARRLSRLLNRQCSAVIEVLASIASYDIIPESNRQCVQISTDLKLASILFLVSAIVLRIFKHITSSRQK